MQLYSNQNEPVLLASPGPEYRYPRTEVLAQAHCPSSYLELDTTQALQQSRNPSYSIAIVSEEYFTSLRECCSYVLSDSPNLDCFQ